MVAILLILLAGCTLFTSATEHPDPYCTVRVSATNLSGNKLASLYISTGFLESQSSTGASELLFSEKNVALPFERSGYAKDGLGWRDIVVDLEGTKPMGVEATVTISVESNGTVLALRTLTIPSGETWVDWRFRSPDL